MTETNPPYAERDIRVEDVALVCDHRERMFLEAGHHPGILTTMTEHFRPWLRDQIERGTKMGRPLYEISRLEARDRDGVRRTRNPPMSENVVGNLAQQVEYYRARASEYDEWWFRKGRYDRGPELNAQWFSDIEELDAALRDFAPRGKVLELAGGTGIWTEKLCGYADELTVVDASSEMLALNEKRIGPGRARYVQANLFDWVPPAQFDVVFFSFWLSHVPDARFESFWRLVRTALAPEGRVFFIDSRKDPTSTSPDQHPPESGSIVERRLNDGRTFNIYKIYYEPEALRAKLGRLGWNADVRSTSRYFIYGRCSTADT